jgi:hypothetical protein
MLFLLNPCSDSSKKPPLDFQLVVTWMSGATPETAGLAVWRLNAAEISRGSCVLPG